MSERAAAGRNSRAHPRVESRIAAKLRLADGSTHVAGEILNISLGGVFIGMEDPLGFGTEFDLELALPGATIRCRGLVVWSTKTSPLRAGGRTGIGVRLMKIGVAEMRELESYISAKLESSPGR